MKLAERIQAFIQLGKYLQDLPPEDSDRYTRLAQSRNGWFTSPNVRFALKYWSNQLQESKFLAWSSRYAIPENQPEPKHVGLLLAGNIPLEGFHDILCGLLSGHHLHIKPQPLDPLPQLLIQKLLEIEPRFAEWVSFQEQLINMQAYVASTDENTARNLAYYVGKVPHLLRSKRNSCAVLSGKESLDELKLLGRDILQYWGLSPRSVGKLFVPVDYYFPRLFESLESWADVQHHHKWANNYDYHKSIYLINGLEHLDTGFLIFKEDAALTSPVTVVYYQYYTDVQELEQLLEQHRGQLQSIVGPASLPVTAAFGQAHRPDLSDYADGIDTMQFLLNL